jgi:tight adherence protein B
MALLVLAFIAIVLVTFGLVVLMTRPSAAEKAMDLRIASIHGSAGDGTTVSPGTTQSFLKADRATSFGWLEAIVQHYGFAKRLQMRILQANSSASVSILILSSLGLFLLGYAIAWFFAPIVLVDIAAAALLFFLPYWILSFRRSRRINSFNAVLADTIDMLARALRAGYSMAGAFEMVSENAEEPAASEFKEVFKQQNLGLPMRDALMQLLDRFPSLDLRVLVQKDTGGNLSEILDRTVFVIRERLRIQGEIRVQTAQGRFTGWILSALPVVMLILINLVNPGYSKVLLTDPTGRMLIYVGVGMLVVGSWIIHYIVSGIEV